MRRRAIPRCPAPWARSRSRTRWRCTRASSVQSSVLVCPVRTRAGVEITYFSDAQLPRSMMRQRSLQKGMYGIVELNFFFTDRTLHDTGKLDEFRTERAAAGIVDQFAGQIVIVRFGDAHGADLAGAQRTSRRDRRCSTRRRFRAPASTAAPARPARNRPTGLPPAPATRGRPARDCARAKSCAGSPSGGACDCKWCARPPCRPARSSRWCLRRNRRTRPAGRTARPATNWHSVSKSASVSPGKSDDHAGADRHAGDGAANALDQLQENIAVRPALHALQHRRAGVLQRHVDVLDQRVVRGDGVEQLLRDLVRDSSTGNGPIFRAASRSAPGAPAAWRAILHPEIFAVAGGVLADQVDLAHALRKQPRGFRRSPIQTGGCGTSRDTAGSRRRCRDDRSLRRS